jgi:hypothetical protein
MRMPPDLQYAARSVSGNMPRARLNWALLALCSIGIGTFAAVESVPDDIGRADALFLPALYMTSALMVPVALQIRSDLTTVLRIENILMVGVVYWLLLDMLQSAYPFTDVSPEHVQWAFITVGAFAVAVWFGATGAGWRLPRIISNSATGSLSTETLYIATLITFFLGISKFVISAGFDPMLMVQGLGMERWGVTPWARGEFGDVNAVLDHMQYFGYVMPSLCVLIAMRIGWLNWRVITGLMLSAIVIAFLAQSGGRRIIGVIVGAAILTWVASTVRLKPKVILGVVSAVAILLILMQEMLKIRNIGFASWWAGNEGDPVMMAYLHVDDNFLRLAELIRFFPDVAQYVLYQPLLHALTLPVPRVLWSGKPTGPGFDLPALLGGYKNTSLSVSIIGELYVSFGIWAVLGGGWMMGRLAGMWNKILQLPIGTARPLLYSLGLMTLFTGIRSMQVLVQMSYIVLAWILIASLLSRSKSSTRKAEPMRL